MNEQINGLLDAAEKYSGSAYKLWVLVNICKLTPKEIVKRNLMPATTVAYNLEKVIFEI